MRYYVLADVGEDNPQKIYIDAENILDIPKEFTLEYNNWDYPFSWKNIKVQDEGFHSATTGAIIGGFIGLIFGPIGIIFCGMMGALIGASKDSIEQTEIKRERKRIDNLIKYLKTD